MAYRATFDEKREFGIELEGFGISRLEMTEGLQQKKISARVGDGFDKNLPGWTVTQDGTIKDTYSLEIVSPILHGEKGLLEIKKVCDVANKLKIDVDESCGLHIHWGVSDYTGRSMINLLRLYGKYEKNLDFIFHPLRREDHNPFAHTLIKNGNMNWLYRLNVPFYYHAFQIAQEFEATQMTSNTSSYPVARHHKVNICAYNKYRTVEFRQHEGTFDFEKVKAWVVLSQQLVNRAKDTLVMEGVATWESMMRTLALTDTQLNESVETPDKTILRETRDSYRKIYRENKKENEQLVCNL